MKQSVNCVLLISDDKATNFFNKMVLNRHKNFDQVISVQSGADALVYLKAVARELESKPDLIFLDLEMTHMSGWEFLGKFNKLDKRIIEDMKVILLSTSNDLEGSKNDKDDYRIDDFINKPLSFPLLDELLLSHFSNRLDTSV